MATKYKEKLIKFECTDCKRVNYYSQKNKKVNKERLELKNIAGGATSIPCIKRQDR